MPQHRLRPVLIGVVLVVLVAVLLVSGVIRLPLLGGFSGGQRDLTQEERAALTASVESSLQGSGPARFVWFPLRERAEGVYCAFLNTSKVYGDHTEDRLFEVSFTPTADHGIGNIVSVYMPGADPGWRQIIQGNCARAGYVPADAGAPAAS